jgi:hypothetical protein
MDARVTRVTLEAGFIAVRDVENEGSGYAQVALRDAINALTKGVDRRRLPRSEGSGLKRIASGSAVTRDKSPT